MNAGLLNKNIIIVEVHYTRNKYGEQDRTLDLKYKTRARVIYDSGSRAEENSELVYNYYKTFQVRHYVPIVETDFVDYDNKLYRILAIETRDDYNDKLIKTELVNE